MKPRPISLLAVFALLLAVSAGLMPGGAEVPSKPDLDPNQPYLMSDNYNARLATPRIPDPLRRLALFSDN